MSGPNSLASLFLTPSTNQGENRPQPHEPEQTAPLSRPLPTTGRSNDQPPATDPADITARVESAARNIILSNDNIVNRTDRFVDIAYGGKLYRVRLNKGQEHLNPTIDPMKYNAVALEVIKSLAATELLPNVSNSYTNIDFSTGYIKKTPATTNSKANATNNAPEEIQTHSEMFRSLEITSSENVKTPVAAVLNDYYLAQMRQNPANGINEIRGNKNQFNVNVEINGQRKSGRSSCTPNAVIWAEHYHLNQNVTSDEQDSIVLPRGVRLYYKTHDRLGHNDNNLYHLSIDETIFDYNEDSSNPLEIDFVQEQNSQVSFEANKTVETTIKELLTDITTKARDAEKALTLGTLTLQGYTYTLGIHLAPEDEYNLSKIVLFDSHGRAENNSSTGAYYKIFNGQNPVDEFKQFFRELDRHEYFAADSDDAIKSYIKEDLRSKGYREENVTDELIAQYRQILLPDPNRIADINTIQFNCIEFVNRRSLPASDDEKTNPPVEESSSSNEGQQPAGEPTDDEVEVDPSTPSGVETVDDEIEEPIVQTQEQPAEQNNLPQAEPGPASGKITTNPETDAILDEF